jgi:ribonuclease HII
MAFLIGIDEAGYGPLLGPLVVSSAAFELPEEFLRSDLWKILNTAVSPVKKGLSGRLLITDSKKAYTSSTGIGHLRRTILSCLHAIHSASSGISLNTAHDLLNALDTSSVPRSKAYPWYKNLHQQSLGHDASDISLAASVLRKSLSEKEIKLVSLNSRCLDVAYFNNRVEQVRNKSRVLFTELCSLIADALDRYPSQQTLQVIVDRQGGRINYHQELLRMFPGSSLTVLRQDEKMSSYELLYNQRTMRIHFCIKADIKYLPVCLASMASKYLREVLMEAQNTYFCGLCKDLKPTAGYWEDGQRFLADLAEKLPSLTFDKKQLIRSL